MKRLGIAVGLGLVLAPNLGAHGTNDDEDASWPQFMGPERSGKVPGSLHIDWSESGPQILWRTDVGKGYGGVSVHGGEVFLLDREVGELDILRVIDLENGETLWDLTYEAPGRLAYPGSRSVPAVTEELVYTCGGHGRVMCIDREGQVDVWTRDLVEEYGGNIPGYGWSCSPLLIGDLVVLTALGDDVGLVAFDRFTGDEVWITTPLGTTHTTPVVMDLLGQEQIVVVSAFPQDSASLDEAGRLTISSYDPEDGSTLWQEEIVGSLYPIPGPVQVDAERFFVTGGYRGGSALVKLVESADGFALETQFRIERGSQIHNPILHDGHLYLVVNENWNDPRHLRKEGGLLCLGLDGEERWRTGDAPYFGRGGWLMAGDHLILQDGKTGVLRVVEASPEGYRQVAEANLFGIEDRRDHQMWAPMALVGERLLLRSQDELLCVKL